MNIAFKDREEELSKTIILVNRLADLRDMGNALPLLDRYNQYSLETQHQVMDALSRVLNGEDINQVAKGLEEGMALLLREHYCVLLTND